MLFVSTITPLRISFVGGGTDYPKYLKKNIGRVISASINKYVYVTIKAHSLIYPENFRIMYSKTESVNKVKDIKNNIVRECLKLLPIKIPASIHLMSDLPPESGTGSSSSFVVGLLKALHEFRGEKNVTPKQLAEEACYIEIVKLKKSCGKQDQYIAAYGGLNEIIFFKNKTIVNPIKIPKKNINFIFNNLCLIWTGIKRNSNNITKTYDFYSKKKLEVLNQLKNLVIHFKKNLYKDKININILNNALHMSWDLKKKFNSNISNKQIDIIYKKLNKIKLFGGKLLGAGGGGFFLTLHQNNKKKLDNLFNKKNIFYLKFESKGSRILYKIKD